MATDNWGLPEPVGTDLVADTDNYITESNQILDNATMLEVGPFSGRASVTHVPGQYYLATDTGFLYLSDGTNWIEVAPGAGAVPIGSLLDYGGSGDPADTRYLLADGRLLSRTTYAALFSVIGTTYGAGDGTTTFGLPDLRGRVAVGPDNMGTATGAAGRLPNSNRVRGQSGGAELHQLAVPELPSHNHSGFTGNANQGHQHFFDAIGTTINTGTAASGLFLTPASYPNGSHLVTSTETVNHQHPITAQGGDGGHNNMQPYTVVNKLIRVA